MTLQLLGMYLAVATLAQQPSAGTNAAVINVAVASERYLRTADLESQFESRRLELRQKGEDYRNRIEQKRRILTEQLKPGTDAFNATQKELAMLEAEAQFFLESNTRMMDQGLANSLRSIYTDIQLAVREVAEEQGYQIVLAVDELPAEMPGNPTAAKQQILLQKVVYWNPRVDITDKVIKRLNARYGAQPVPSDGQSKSR
ncbi:MAG: OmpH/Skp family outer membrane protein [Planctomycetota bacterium]|jgi:Skp family chaperone for outer membrane proteins